MRKYWIPSDINSQLAWLKTREQWNVLKEWVYWSFGKRSPRCGTYWESKNYKDWYAAGQDAVVACMYRYHYHANDGTWYAKKAMKAREYYLDYFKTK